MKSSGSASLSVHTNTRPWLRVLALSLCSSAALLGNVACAYEAAELKTASRVYLDFVAYQEGAGGAAPSAMATGRCRSGDTLVVDIGESGRNQTWAMVECGADGRFKVNVNVPYVEGSVEVCAMAVDGAALAEAQSTRSELSATPSWEDAFAVDCFPMNLPGACDEWPNHGDAFASGDGSEANPWTICTADTLRRIGNDTSLWADHFVVARTIYFDSNNPDAAMPPIGNSAIPFSGTFYGSDRSIEGAVIDTSAAPSALGIFGVVEADAGRGDLEGRHPWSIRAARVTYVTATTDIPSVHLGGLVGLLKRGRVESSKASRVTLSASGLHAHVGSLIGTMQPGTECNVCSASSPDVSSTALTGANRVGGLVGFADQADIVEGYVGGMLRIRGGPSNDGATGGLVGRSTGNILNTAVEGMCDAADDAVERGLCIDGNRQVGGLAGAFSGWMQDSRITLYYQPSLYEISPPQVRATSGEVGGCVGTFEESSTPTGLLVDPPLLGINNCDVHMSAMEATAIDNSPADFIGGVVGLQANHNAEISDCHAHAMNSKPIKLRGRNGVGGLAGGSTGSVVHNRAQADITGIAQVGGLIGATGGSSTHIEDNTATCTINGQREVGGLVGSLTGLLRTGSADATIDAVREAGGLVGLAHAGAVIYDSEADGTVNATLEAGGLVGVFAGDTIERSEADVEVSVVGSHAGGLVGLLDGDTTIVESGARGAVNIGESGGGGLIGSVAGRADIMRCFASGDITGQGSGAIGGLVGITQGGSIIDSYASGDALNGQHIGGLVGHIDDRLNAVPFDISTSLYRGTTDPNAALRGVAYAKYLAGQGGALPTVQECYFGDTSLEVGELSSPTGCDYVAYGTGTSSLGEAFPNFDADIWWLPYQATFPRLRWQSN